MKSNKSSNKKPVVPDFGDVDKTAAQRAQAALAGGGFNPLKVPQNAKTSQDDKGNTYSRFAESVQIMQAYRTVTKKKLMDVTVIAKVRQSEDNTGRKVAGHFYINNAGDLSEGHEKMNDRSMGALISLLQAVDLMPESGSLRGSLLNKLFPPKGQPGATTPLSGKVVIANICQQTGPKKDQNTGKPVLDEDDEPILDTRDQIESFLPESESDDDEDVNEDEDEAGEDEDEDEGEDEGDEDEGEDADEDEDGDEDADEDEEEEEEEKEEEEEPVRRPAKKTVKGKTVKKKAAVKKGQSRRMR